MSRALMMRLPPYSRSALLADIVCGAARKVDAAGFSQGAEDEIRTEFYRWRGLLIHHEDNRRTTVSVYSVVEGEDLDIFDAYYPDRIAA